MNHIYKNKWVRHTSIGVMALAMMATGMPAQTAHAATLAELQAQVQQLMAQLSQIQGGSTATLSCGPFTQNLTLGQSGSDVTALQNFLIRNGFTISAGATGYFGEQTRSAVSAFQSANGIMPTAGFFGPATRAKVNALCTAVPSPNVPTPGKDDSGNKPVTLRGEGELRTFEFDEASKTDIKSAASDAPVAELTLEARNGDIRITRMDFALVADSGNSEKDPWDSFEDISIWKDGKKIAEKAIDRKSDYLNNRQGTFRFTGLDLVIKEDDELELTIAVTLPKNVRGAGSAAEWSLTATALRYFDGDNSSTDDKNTGDLGDSVDFTIVERGHGEELKFSVSRNNPEASTIVVDDSSRTNNTTILTYDIEAIDADIELDRLAVNIETGSAAYDDVVHAVRLVIGNKTFRSDSIVTTGAYSTTSVNAVFDIDGDITIDEGDTETVKVIVDFKPQTLYSNDETIVARITSTERDYTKAEGSDDITTFSGSVVGKMHRLIADGLSIDAESVKFSTKTQGQDATTGIFTMDFKVTAVEGDYYVKSFASTSSDATTGGARFTVEGAASFDSVTAILTSTADEDTTDVFTVREGETETFTLLVTVDPSVTGQYRIGLDRIMFSDNTDGVTNATVYSVNPLNKFRSPFQFINN
jgi:hypothetical protein